MKIETDTSKLFLNLNFLSHYLNTVSHIKQFILYLQLN